MPKVMISLNMIKAQDPCDDGWEKILAARGGDDADFYEMFPLLDAFDSNGFDDVLWALCCLPELDNLWRKYCVWMARQVQHLMTDRRSVAALEVAWRHSEGLATDDELTAAGDAAWDAGDAARAAWAAAGDAAGDAAWDAARAAWAAAGDAARAAAVDAQEAKLRQILEAGEWVE